MKLSSLITPFMLPIAALTCMALPATATDASAPEHHEAAYSKFKEALNTQAAANSPDPCPAILIALNATGDEFCLDSWMQRAAKEGNAVALNYIGTANLYYVPSNLKQSKQVKDSVALVKKAADKKYAPAMVDYSTFMRSGVGTFENKAGADRILLEACKSGNFETRFSWLLQTDRLMKYEDLNRPEVKGEIERGNHHVVYYLSGKAPDKFTALTMLTRAARMGNHSAMYELSTHLSTVNAVASYHYLKAAAAQHNPEALCTLGSYLISDNKKLAEELGVQTDPEAGIHLLKIAGMLGNTVAQAKLAHIYFHGLCGMPKDAVKAYKHTQNGAMARPDVAFMTAQGYMLMSGSGVAKDVDKGYELIKLAAKQRYPQAIAMQAYVNYRGIGIPSNGKEAAFLLESLATQGFDICFVYLALMYDEGSPTLPQDSAKVKYYMEHARRGLGDRAQQVFDYQKNNFNGWALSPFDIHI